MSIEAITDAIHEYMYEKLNESTETEEVKKIRHLDKRKLTKKKNEPNGTRRRDDWTATNAVHPTGPNSMNVPPEERNAQNAVNWANVQNAADQ